MEPTRRLVLNEWRAHWTLVVAALVGSSFAALPVYSMAFFIEPLSGEFGWSRTQVSVGLSIFAFIVTPLAPFAGALIDRWGPRPVALIGLTLTTAAVASLGLTTGALSLWIGQWVIYALAACCLKVTLWTAAVASVFKAGRGMALALTICGTAVAQTIAPLLSNWLIEATGWRHAYVGLAIGWGGLALVLCVFFLRDARSLQAPLSAETNAGAPAPLEGLSIQEALRSAALYRIGGALAISSIVSVAVVTHKVSILHEMNITRDVAAQIAATAGAAGIAGKLITGWLYDRKFSAWIGGLAFGIPALGFALMVDPIRTPLLIVVAMIFVGLGSGSALQATVYLIARYAGLRNYGKIFGSISSVIALSVGLGPLLGGAIYDATGSYSLLIVLGIPLSLFAAGLVMWPSRRPAAAAAGAAATATIS